LLVLCFQGTYPEDTFTVAGVAHEATPVYLPFLGEVVAVSGRADNAFIPGVYTFLIQVPGDTTILTGTLTAVNPIPGSPWNFSVNLQTTGSLVVPVSVVLAPPRPPLVRPPDPPVFEKTLWDHLLE
jgi:hypothetical protein